MKEGCSSSAGGLGRFFDEFEGRHVGIFSNAAGGARAPPKRGASPSKSNNYKISMPPYVVVTEIGRGGAG